MAEGADALLSTQFKTIFDNLNIGIDVMMNKDLDNE